MNIRTVGELIEYLEDYDEDLPIRIMSQPSWPFEHSIQGVVAREDINPDSEGGREKENCLFILEGNQLCYGDKNAWD